MSETSNAYTILGVPKGISEKDLRNAYVLLVKKYDPEKHTERFMVIQKAFDKLRNVKTRAQEDVFTYNPPSGDYLFSAEERVVNNQGPTENEVAKKRAEYRENASNEEIRKGFVLILCRHASHHVVRKQLVEAIRDWDEILEIEPTHSRTRHNLHHACCALGHSYALHGLHEEATELWEKALRLNPDDTNVVHNLALSAEKAENHAKAGKYWAETVARWKSRMEKERDNEYLKLCVVEALQHHGDYVDAHKAHLPKPAVAAVAPSAASGSAKPAGAAPAAAPTAGAPRSARPAVPAAAIAANQPAPSAPAAPQPTGIDRYREIARLKPDDFDAQFQLCSKLIEAQMYEDALSELGKLTRSHPKNTEALNLMGWAFLSSGKKDEGFNCWKRSMAIDPKNAETRDHMVRAHLTLGRTSRSKGMFTQALVHFKQLLALMPRSVEVHMEIAATYDMKGDVRSAANEYARVLEIDPKHKDARKAMNDLRMKK
jgi:tetratricopeptide (TPR) repeat protein